MNYKGIEYVVRARPGRDQWTFVISYPRSANPTEIRLSGSRDEAIAAACRRIDGWLKRQRTMRRGDEQQEGLNDGKDVRRSSADS